MFRLLPITLLPILSLASVVHAGLNHTTLNSAIAVCYFEQLTDSTARSSDITLHNGATLVENSIFEKGMKITGNASFTIKPNLTPATIGREFSIIARVKIPKQNESCLHFGYAVLNSNSQQAGNITMSIMPDGNLRGTRTNYDINGKATNEIKLVTDAQNVTDDEWHYIAFTKYGHTYALFVDGKLIGDFHVSTYFQVQADLPLIFVGGSVNGIQGDAIIDNLGFFETGFSPFEIKSVYQNGLYNFLEIMPVDPQGKVATTWGEIKAR